MRRAYTVPADNGLAMANSNLLPIRTWRAAEKAPTAVVVASTAAMRQQYFINFQVHRRCK